MLNVNLCNAVVTAMGVLQYTIVVLEQLNVLTTFNVVGIAVIWCYADYATAWGPQAEALAYSKEKYNYYLLSAALSCV